MNTYINFILKQRFLVITGVAGLMVAGLMAWRSLPIDAFPDVTNVQVMILAKAPGLAAVDVEQRVSYPIELVMRGLPRVKQVRSLSKAGLSQVVIVFEDGVDTYWTRQVVFERLSMARDQLPAGVAPELGPISTGLGEVLQYTVEGEGKSAMELRTVQDWIIAPLLKPLPGVNEVNSFGGKVKQYQVLVAPEKLLKYGLTVGDIVAAVEQGNANAAGGVVLRDWEQLYMRGVGLLKDIPDIERVVLKSKDGSPVYIRDVAEVTIGTEPRQGAVSRDGKGEAVAGMIIMLKGANSKDVVSRVKAQIDKLKDTLPAGVRLNVFYDRTSLIEACIKTVVDALLAGGIFVILVLFLFVAEFRTALIVVFSLPLTFLVSFIVMGSVGLTSNLMSLGGLAFSVGMVVDASIVVVENVRRHLAQRPDPEHKRRIVVEALVEVAKPVSFSVLIIAIILVPLFTLQGIEGKMFAPLAATMLIALLVSLVVALTAVPVLAEKFLLQKPEREFGFIRRFHSGYMCLLGRAVRHPAWTLGISGGVLVASCAFIPFVGTEFMPPLDEGSIAINVVRLPNASLDGSVEVAGFIEKRLHKFPEIETVISKTGRAEISEDPMGPEQTDVFIMLKPRQQWGSGRNKAELVEAIQQDLGQLPGLRYSFSQPIALRVNELISGVKSDLAVKVFGPDLEILKTFSDRAAAVLQGVDGSRDVKVEMVSGMAQIDAVIDREILARYGIKIADVNAVIEAAIAGKTATTLIEEQRRFAVVVRFPEAARRDIPDLERLLIATPAGGPVQLAQLAKFTTIEAPAQISRENGMRRVVAEVNIRGRDLGGFVSEVQGKLAP
ncbi:MAG: CusA/CzcA family heavy metal efflux RND transporter, partial [Verrucomicrobiota bacterium]